MSQPNAQAQVQHPQPSVGSIAAHRPHTVAGVVSDLEPDIDADLDGYEEAPNDGAPLPQGRFLDRERSWLAFNERVLELAEDERMPLLERVKFLAIYTSNLDEFIMVRVAGLHDQVDAGIDARKADGLSPSETITLIGESSGRWLNDRELVEAIAGYWTEAGLTVDLQTPEFGAYLDILFDRENRRIVFEGLTHRYVIRGQDVTSFQPVQAGETLSVSEYIESTYEKEGKRGGTMRFAVVVTEFRDPSDTLVAEARATYIERSAPPKEA